MHDLLKAANFGNLEEVKNQIENLNVNANLKMNDVDQRTAIYFAAAHNHTEIVRYLLKNKANPNIADSNLWTPLHVAAEKNYYNIVLLLIKAGANLGAKNNLGQTPYRVAELKSSYHVLSLLASYNVEDTVNISKEIKPKICKVNSDYGSATGFFINDEEGTILTSFHLLGRIKPYQYYHYDLNLIILLLSSGYLNDKLYFTDKAIRILNEEVINSEINKVDKNTVEFSINFDINKNLIQNVITRYPNYKKILFEFFKNKENQAKNHILEDLELAACLVFAGYLSSNEYCFERKALQVKHEDDINLDIGKYDKLILKFNITANDIKSLILNINSKFPNYKRDLLNCIKDNQKKIFVSLLSTKVEIEFDNEILFGEVYFPEGKNSKKILENYAVFDALPIKVTHYSDQSLFSDRYKYIDTGKPIIPLPPSEIPLQEGETVYFGGYPLDQNEYTFIKGTLSSIQESSIRKILVIEAAIAAGNSGSPVYVKRNNQIYFIGIINSEVAYITEEIHDIRDKLTNQGEMMKLGNVPIVSSLREITEVLLRNLSTGIGKAVYLDNFQKLYDEEFDTQSVLASIPLDFLVDKKVRILKQEEKLRFFEYTNQNKITKLLTHDIIKYYNLYSDSITKSLIYSLINFKNVSDKTFIKFPPFTLMEDIYIKPIGADLKLDLDGDIGKIVAEDEVCREKIKSLYLYAVLIGQQRIKDGLFRFESYKEIPIKTGSYVTVKFFEDHIGDANRNLTEVKADEVAERRAVLTSTLIPSSELQSISNEVAVNQARYREAEIKAITQEKSSCNRIIHSLFFLSKKPYQLISRSNNEQSPQRTNSSFYYSVIKKLEGERAIYYMHHFEGSAGTINPTQRKWERIQDFNSEAYYKTYTPRI